MTTSSVSSSSSSSSISQFFLTQIQKARTEKFSKADTDGSGGLSLTEFSAMGTQSGTTQDATKVASAFTKLDANGDGSLSQDELDAGTDDSALANKLSSELLTALFQIIGNSQTASNTSSTQSSGTNDFLVIKDEDGDGNMSLDEMLKSASANGLSETDAKDLFTQLDTDGDGIVTADETQSFNDQVASNSPPPPPPRTSGSGKSEQTYDAMDTNKDGVVSVDELMAALSGTEDTNTTASTTTKDNENSVDSAISQIKTALKSFLLAVQEQQQKQTA